LGSWIESFLEFTQILPTTDRFRIWAAIGTIAAALERKVYTVSADKALYPNLYTILVGPPGTGKTIAIEEGRTLLHQLDKVHLAPTVTTKEYLYDLMEKTHSADVNVDTGVILEQSALSAFADEFAVFLKRGDVDFMVALSKLYDCPPLFDKGTRHHGVNDIIRPWLNIMGGATPFWLKETFTDDAFETGFPARVILVYDETPFRLDLWNPVPARKEKAVELLRDLRQINLMKGEYLWSRAAMKFLQEWINDGMGPKIADRKFVHYNRRRPIQILKLSMIMAASRTSELVVEEIDVQNAKVILLDAESSLGKVAKAMGSNPYKSQMDTIYAYISRTMENGFASGVPEYRVRQHISREMPLNFIGPTLENMIDMKMIEVVDGDPPSRMLATGKLTFEEDYDAE